MSCLNACLHNGIYSRRMCLTGRPALQENRSYLRLCLIEGHVLQEDMSYSLTILQHGISNRRKYLT